MKTEVIFNSDLHFEHENWRRELYFWEDELKSFQNRLDELSNRWTDMKVLAEVEKFQNKFLIHENTIDRMKEDILMHETNMAEHFRMNEDVLDRKMVKKHLKFRDDMDDQRKIYHDLKKEFFKFLTRYM